MVELDKKYDIKAHKEGGIILKKGRVSGPPSASPPPPCIPNWAKDMPPIPEVCTMYIHIELADYFFAFYRERVDENYNKTLRLL